MSAERTLLITGGTGTFGNAVTGRMLAMGFGEIRIFSRDEKKQDDMRRRWADPRIKYYLGDVRDEQSLRDAMAGVNLVFHAAALKQVPSCEFFPIEAVRTNTLGTEVARILNPTPTVIVDPVTIVNQVRSLARLETIQYTVEKVITAETRQDIFAPLFGDRLIFIAHGNVIAGIDMMSMGPDDMWVRDEVLYVRLPEAEIFISALDNDASYVYDRDTGLLTKGEVNLETLARQSAEDEIEKAALEDGILDQAQINAEVFLQRFLLSLGYKNISFVGLDTEPSP